VPATQLINRLELISKSMSRKGSVSAIGSTSLVNILTLINRMNEISKYVECLSSNKNACMKTAKGVLCTSDCSNTFKLDNDVETKLWKTGSNAFGFTLSSDYIELGIKDTKIEVTQDKINVKIENSSIIVPLEEKSIIENSSIIINAANRIDEVIRHAFSGISSCARNSGIKC